MTIIYSPAIITCLSSDTKPTTVPVGMTCQETDTNNKYIWTGSVWLQLIVITSGSTINLAFIPQLPALGTGPSPARQTAIITSEISNNQITIPKLFTKGESAEANSAHTLTAANMVTNSILTCTPTVNRIWTSDTAANIIALIGAVTGNWFEFTIVSKAAFTITLATATGLTLSGNLVCAANGSATFIGIVTGASTMAIIRKS